MLSCQACAICQGSCPRHIVIFFTVSLRTILCYCVYIVICVAHVCSLSLWADCNLCACAYHHYTYIWSCQACATCLGSCPRQACLQGNLPQLPFTCLFHCCRSGCDGSSGWWRGCILPSFLKVRQLWTLMLMRTQTQTHCCQPSLKERWPAEDAAC